MIKFIKGDLIKQCNLFDVLVHGCNCHWTLGAGIARTISDTWEYALQADKLSVKGEFEKLGSYTSFEVLNSKTKKKLKVINAYTQFQPNPPVDYLAIEHVMEALKLKESGK